jgi:hypothetical protein
MIDELAKERARTDKTSIPRMSNVEYLRYILEYGNPMKQAMVIQAITTFTGSVVAAGEEKVTEMMESNGGASIVSPRAWFQTAVELKKDMEEKYGHS